MPETVEVDGLTLTVSKNEAGYRHVAPTKSGKWQAKPTLEKGGGQVDLGSFDSPIDAAKAVARKLLEVAASGQAAVKVDKKDRASRGAKRSR